MKRLHQFLAGFAHGDAISNEALRFRELFRAWGFESEIFCEPRRVLPELRAQTRDAASFAADCRPDDVVLLHLSIGSGVNDAFGALRCRRAVLYHNITPPHYLAAVNRQTADMLDLGRRQAAALAGRAEVALADSTFNAREIEAMGYRDVRVLPVMVDPEKVRRPVDRAALREFDDGRVNILFVGRCVPNKRIDDLLRFFHVFRSCVRPDARLVHAGSFAGTERYYSLLLGLARNLGLENVRFAGAVPQPTLNALYRAASVFVSMSEHEGFCVPVIEAMACGVPVVAFASSAVPETMGGAGICFAEKDFPAVAEMVAELVDNAAFRRAVIARQNFRVAEFARRDIAAELRAHLAPLLGP